MICPKCLGVARMMKTATPGKSRNLKTIQEFLSDGLAVFGWWSQDFEVRERYCRKCGAKFKTIEVSITDLRDAFDDIEDNKPLGKPWKSDTEELPPLDKSDPPDVGDSWRTQSNLCG
jgi:hypothetical protein